MRVFPSFGGPLAPLASKVAKGGIPPLPKTV